MRVKVTVILDVDWCDEDLGEPKAGDPLEERILASVEDAVFGALLVAERDGYVHKMENELSVCVRRVEGELVRDK